MVSIAPPLPMPTEVAGEEGSWDIVSQVPLLKGRVLEGKDGSKSYFFLYSSSYDWVRVI